ncbi:LPS export ABC transporter periplasmic protein LptC [Dysgonomonas sp. Marseille-P4361]|uniref:LPS export ABC transporter periplasmic protein LptC n=1 Tax=Dysgonomonas sp. Marseille-P4361 TaxID=2161820 RepID=UPI002100FA5E|nr:LPS export ABC transporter periplasmic protein LptC [Dysgonomonas sp. Marseille-P4361]
MLRRKGLFFIMVLLFSIPFVLASCKDNSKSVVDYEYDKETMPIINTDSVSTLISDSGIIKYKVLAKTWEMYDRAKDDYWYFPDGIYLEQFDTLFNIVVSVKADTAWNFSDKKLWKLTGNVFIENHQTKDTYSSPEFYWDQQKRMVYSDSVVTINSPEGGLINASKFSSDERLTNIVFVSLGELSSRGKGLIYVNEDEEGTIEEKDSVSTIRK